MSRNTRFILGAVFLLVVSRGSFLSAQTSSQVQVDPAPKEIVLTLAQIHDAEQWAADFEKWQKSVERWRTLRYPAPWSSFSKRHPKPEPPAWLADACPLLGADPQFTRACELYSRWEEDPLASRTRQNANAAIAQKEKPTNTSWFRHVHLDGLWSTTQSNVSAFGVFGMHVTVPIEGRMQVFLAPGIMLVSVPTFYGTREMRAATDWGITYRLFDAGPSTVHFNLVQAWLLGGTPNVARPRLTLAGLSLSFRPSKRK